MSESLIELCNHNVWANDVLFEACDGLTNEQLDAAIDGTFGNIRSTLMHIAGAQERIAVTLAGTETPGVRRDQAPFPGIAALRDSTRSSGMALSEIAANAQPGATVATTWRGEAYTLPVWLLLAQALTHATEHRTQIAAILTQQGIDPPGMDVWSYHEDRFDGDWSRLWSW